MIGEKFVIDFSLTRRYSMPPPQSITVKSTISSCKLNRDLPVIRQTGFFPPPSSRLRVRACLFRLRIL